jgi:hypothetical protein
MLLAEEQRVVETLAAKCSHKPLGVEFARGVRTGVRRAREGRDDPRLGFSAVSGDTDAYLIGADIGRIPHQDLLLDLLLDQHRQMHR